MMKCAFCGGGLNRKKWHGGSEYVRDVWECSTSTKKGKRNCPHSKGIPEEAIEKAFVESYRQLCNDNKDVMDAFLKKLNETLDESKLDKQLTKNQRQISILENKKNNLIDMKLDSLIDERSFESKYAVILSELNKYVDKQRSLKNSMKNEQSMKKRLAVFRKTLQDNQVLDEFDRYVFESIVEKVIIGEIDQDGTIDPYKITFIYKTGFTDAQNGRNFKPQRKNKKEEKNISSSNELYKQASDEVDNLYSYSSDDAC